MSSIASDRKSAYIKLVALAAALLAPLALRNSTYIILLMCTSAISIIVVSGLDILFGYSGQISLGHAGFYCIGAYTSAILSRSLGVPVWVTLLAGAVLSALVAVLIALPSIKLVHHFLALMTIAFGQLAYLFVANTEKLTGGFSGYNFIPQPSIGSFVFNTNVRQYYLILLFVVIFLLIKQRIIHSRTGRAFVAIRENTPAADGMGVDVRKYKVMAFAISAFYTGFGGGLYAHLIGFISPENYHLSQSIVFLTMLLFGGMGNFWGPIIGSILLTAISEYLQALGSYQMLVYGSLLLTIIIFVPGGVTGGFNPLQLLREHRRKRRQPEAG